MNEWMDVASASGKWLFGWALVKSAVTQEHFSFKKEAAFQLHAFFHLAANACSVLQSSSWRLQQEMGVTLPAFIFESHLKDENKSSSHERRWFLFELAHIKGRVVTSCFFDGIDLNLWKASWRQSLIPEQLHLLFLDESIDHTITHTRTFFAFAWFWGSCLDVLDILSPLSALGQIMLYVDGMNGVIGHVETIQWLYTLVGSKVNTPVGARAEKNKKQNCTLTQAQQWRPWLVALCWFYFSIVS